jgi:hypothetical protein
MIAFGFIDSARYGYRLGGVPFAGGDPIATCDVPGPTTIRMDSRWQGAEIRHAARRNLQSLGATVGSSDSPGAGTARCGPGPKRGDK